MRERRSSALSGMLLAVVLAGCSSGQTGGMDRETRIKFDQYMAKGENLYAVYCINCHQDKGQGLAMLYPPLAKSDYLLADMGRAACIVRYGQFKEIVVNGTSYSQMMPGLSELTNLEIAEILTFVGNSWGNEAGFQSVKDVEVWLSNCEE